MNLARVQPEALGEVVASFRRQVLRRNFADPDSFEQWRLEVLDKALLMAKVLPGVGKAFAGKP